jgi:Nucleotidyltransferase
MNGVNDRESFERLVTALAPWLDHVVVVGGWAHQLYRLHPHAQELEYLPLMTLDTDVAVPAKLPVGEHDIRERLLAHGFTEELFGDSRPPATHYRLGGGATGFYAEFLTPLIGSQYDREHKRKVTMDIAGVISQQLRHIELLLHHPWSIDFESDALTAKIQVANPVSFLAQKVLIHHKRQREDRAKDILYMHDTFEVFGARLPEMQELWRDIVSPELNPRGIRTVSTASEALFGNLSDDIRRAAAISAERGLSPEDIWEACRYGFTQVFGTRPTHKRQTLLDR